MAHKKGVGSSKNGRESESKRLGVKESRSGQESFLYASSKFDSLISEGKY